MSKTLTILGCGTMGRAVLGGLVASRFAEDWNIRVTDLYQETVTRLMEEFPVEGSTDNAVAVRGADVVLLATKPHVALKVIGDLGSALDGCLLISVCAGVTLSQLARLAPGARCVRAMPNTPALIREGMTILSLDPKATEEDATLAEAIFSAVGRVRVLPESNIDACTGLAGSGPAFVFTMLDAMADGGVKMGLKRDVATELAAQTMLGAARLVLESGEHPAVLRDRVTTPAGCTIAGLFRLEEGALRSTIGQAVAEAARVAGTLGDETS